jgi:hypothetical protein
MYFTNSTIRRIDPHTGTGNMFFEQSILHLGYFEYAWIRMQWLTLMMQVGEVFTFM